MVSGARLLRNLILISIGLAAVLAILAILGVDVGTTGVRIIGTSFLITGCAIVVMPSLAAWEQDRLGVLPVIGMVTAVIGFGWLIVGVWLDYSGPEWTWKVPTTLVIAATTIGGVALIGFARLEPAWAWLKPAAGAAMTGVAAALTAGLWGEFDNEAYWRAFAVAAVIMAAILAAIPVLHQRVDATVTTSHCPFCGNEHVAPLGRETTCPSCGNTYTVSR